MLGARLKMEHENGMVTAAGVRKVTDQCVSQHVLGWCKHNCGLKG